MSAQISNKDKEWIEAKARHRLSDAHVQMARELGMNPRKLGKIDNHEQERWKAPLPVFIEELYLKRFGKERPDTIRAFDDQALLQAKAAKKARKQEKKLAARARPWRYDNGCREFYDGLASEYELIYANWAESVRRQGAVLHAFLGNESDPVLDVAAGMGTQAIGLALHGNDVVARDLSPALIQRAKREATRLGVTLELGVGDMREERPEHAGRFGTVIAFDNALPHLISEPDLLYALRAIRAALRPGGRFLATLRDYDALVVDKPAFDPPRVLGEAPHRRMVTQLWTWAPDGKTYELVHLVLREDRGWAARPRRATYRALLRGELEAAALAVGLIDVAWIPCSESGFHQPIFSARRDC